MSLPLRAVNNLHMDFIETKVSCKPEFAEIFMVEFAEVGFDSFIENNEGFNACIDEKQFNEKDLQSLNEKYTSLGGFTYQINKIEKKNWNEEWEKNYDPIIVSDKCIVKTSFHNIEKSYLYEILINPKMSFGTGHHATTFLMLSNQLNWDFKGLRVLDAGCGTGILGIMASMAGALHIDSCDIDEWSVENSIENIALNNCQNINIFHGKVYTIPHEVYNIILANINKNVLLEEISQYAKLQAPAGRLLLSGFYEEDINDIETCCKANNYKKISFLVKDRWACVHFEKLNTGMKR